MTKTIESFQRDLSSVRTGRASLICPVSIGLLAYEFATPVNQIAGISVVEAVN